MLPPEEAQERWTGIRFDTRVLFSPDGGRLDAEEAVATFQSEAAATGPRSSSTPASTSIHVRPDDRVEVPPPTGPTSRTPSSSTAGAWTERLLGAAVTLPRLVVTPGAAGPLRGRGPGRGLAELQPPARARDRALRLLVLADLRHPHAGRGRQGRLARASGR